MKNKMHIGFVLLLLLAGCAHQLDLVARDKGPGGTGVAQEAGKKVSITLNGKNYDGTYIYDGVHVSMINSSGNAVAYSGTRSAVAYGNSYGTAYTPGTGQGRVFAKSSDGDSIRCEFQYSQGSGLGVCQDSDGKLYDLIIH